MTSTKDLPILCHDVIFKSLFINNVDLLLMFIKDITNLNFKDMHLYCNERPIMRDGEKFKRCDFILRNDNHIINIELNSNYYDTLIIKNTCYVFSLFSTDASSGKEYNKDLVVIQININNFTRFNKPILDFKIIDNTYSNIYLNNIEIFDLDIVKSSKVYYNEDEKGRNYLKWGALFASTTLEEIDNILSSILPLEEKKRIMDELRKITMEVTTMSEVEALREDDKFRRSIYHEGMDKGMKKGEENKSLSMIKSLLKSKIDKKAIAKASGKSIEEINKIEKSIK